MMKPMKHNLLDSIVNYQTHEDKLKKLESRANHVISSLINLLESIDDEFDNETASDLKKRIILCVKNKDYSRFERAVLRLNKDNRNGESK